MKQSFFFKDPVMKNFHDKYGPAKIIENNIKPNSTVLDVGCNSGLLALHLKKKKCIVNGIDINKKALTLAKKHCQNTYYRDLYKPHLLLNKNKYDYIIFSDILEHLPQPDLLLQDAKKYLKKTGTIFISLPNIARIELRLSHLFGHFNYSPGILSPDHLRFFTYDTATKLITDSGYKIQSVFYTGLGQRLKIFPKLFSFQFVFEVKPKS